MTTTRFAPQPGAPVYALRGPILTESGLLPDGLLVVNSEQVGWVGSADAARDAGYENALTFAHRTASGHLILPGLVDGHCHGGGGVSFPDALDADQATRATREHLAHGTTTLIGSLVTADRATLLRQVAILAELCTRGELAGIHLEGPFLAPARCGAQDQAYMQNPCPELVSEIARAARGFFTTMTIAPELPGTLGPDEVLESLARANAIPAIGHTDANYAAVEAGIAAARTALTAADARAKTPIATHLFNGMRPLHHRDPGPIGACLAAAARGAMIVELIADGVHLAPETVRTVFQLLGPRHIMLVTDAMAAAGMPDGEYDLGPARVRVSHGVARLRDGDAIAGGTAHLLDVVRSTVAAGVAIEDALVSATLTPARALGLESQVGALRSGLRADVLIVDSWFHPVAVARAGRWEHVIT